MRRRLPQHTPEIIAAALGIGLIGLGVGLVSIPAALVVVGLALLLLAVFGG